MLPARYSRTSSSDGLGFSASSARTLSTKPGGQWQRAQTNPGRIGHRVGDGRRSSQNARLPNALRAVRAGAVRLLDDDGYQFVRQIEDGRQLVIEQRAVDQLALLEDHLVEQR